MRIGDEDLPKIAAITQKAVRKYISDRPYWTQKGRVEIDTRWPRIVRVLGDRFIVVFEVVVRAPIEEGDLYETYHLEQVHVVFRVVWKDGQRFLRVLDVHDDGSQGFYQKFDCGLCPTDMMRRK